MPSIATLSAKSVQRVAAFLAALAAALPPDHGSFLVNQDRLCAETQLPGRTLARALSVLEDARVIQHKRGRFSILDRERLFHIAEGGVPRARKASSVTVDKPPPKVANQPPIAPELPPSTPPDGVVIGVLKSLVDGLRAEVSVLRAEVSALRFITSENLPPATFNLPPATFDSAALVSPIVSALDGLRAEVSALRCDLAKRPPNPRAMPLSKVAEMPPVALNMPPSKVADTPPNRSDATSDEGKTAMSSSPVEGEDMREQLQALIMREGGKVRAARVLGISESGVRNALKEGVSPRLAERVRAALVN